ncbi:hypothetical protein C1H76_8601 [Elsinoe australis]|uniref:Uncharacterized protein n=1 Tax=Elsinoe australis TaxID=40998 RepID=A0A4U7AMC5_9PEZI|nr:hypothetical protein C1H76_8601 [Elsinoe australis]
MDPADLPLQDISATSSSPTETLTANNPSTILRRRSACTFIQKYLDESHEFDEIDLHEPTVPTSAAGTAEIFKMTKDGRAAEAKMPEPADYDYTTTTAEEDFEAIHADPRNDLSGSYIDADAVSESGQSAETVSVCDQSDGDTVDSVDSNTERVDHRMSGSQLKFPDPVILPTTAISKLATASTTKSGQHNLEESEDEGQGTVDHSEITVCAADDTNEPPKKTKESTHDDSRPNGGIVHILSGCLEYLKTHVESVIPEGRPRGMIKTAAATLGMTAVLGVFLIALFNLSTNFIGATPMYAWNGQVVDAHNDMIQRHNQLRPILNAKGLIGWDEKEITPADVLKYPRVYVLGDQARHESKYTFQTGVNVNFLGPDQIFIALPKQKNGKKYLAVPKIQVRRWGKEVSIVSQEDLIDGLTYVVLEPDSPEDVYQIDVKSGHISTTVHACSRKPVSLSGWRESGDQRSSNKSPASTRRIAHHLRALARDIRQLSTDYYVSTINTAAGYRQTAQKPIADAGNILRRYQTWQNQKLRGLLDRINGATTFSLDEAKKDFSDMKRDISDATRTAKKVSESLSTKAITSILQVFDAAQPGVDAVVNQTGHILSRAQRNGKGIFKRIVFALENFHYETGPAVSAKSLESDETPCGNSCKGKCSQKGCESWGWYELDWSKMSWLKRRD